MPGGSIVAGQEPSGRTILLDFFWYGRIHVQGSSMGREGHAELQGDLTGKAHSPSDPPWCGMVVQETKRDGLDLLFPQ